MFEIGICNSNGMEVLYSDIHVETGLDVILRDSLFFEILGCSSMGIRECFIFLGYPTSLDSCFLFLVAFLFFVLTK